MSNDKKLTFDDLPQSMEELLGRMERLERLLLEVSKEKGDEALDAERAAEFLGMSPATIRSKASRGELPKPSRRGKKNYWSKQELQAWLLSGSYGETPEEKRRSVENMRKARESKNHQNKGQKE